jgi:phospholipid/cholesterol/gamma-HCH transport system substrate-binding protein
VKRSGDIPWGQYRLGLLILVALAIFLWASIRGGATFLEHRVLLVARFPDVGGLNQGSPVSLRGIEVGTVKNLSIEPAGDSSYVEVVMSVKRETLANLREDGRARISSINFFGEKYVELLAGRRTGPARAGQLLRSEQGFDVNAAIEQGQGTLVQIKRLSEDLDQIAAKVRGGQGSLGLLVNDRGLYDDLRRLSAQTEELARGLDDSQRRTAQSLIAMSGQLDSLAARMNRGEGSLGMLARDPALYHSLAGMAGGADSVLGKVNAGQGTAGMAVNDPRAYQELTKSLQRLNALLADIQKNPKRYFKFSVF